MNKRDSTDFPVIWVHVDMKHPGTDNLLVMATVQHDVYMKGQAVTSVNVSRDGTEALIKIAGAGKVWGNGLGTSPLVKAVFNADDHHLALALVTTPEWLPLPEVE